MRMRMLLALTSLWLAAPASAAVIGYVVAPASVAVGAQFDIELRGNLGEPVLGWGVDLGFNPAVVQQVGAPTIGPDWIAVSASDGDGLAGIAAGGLTGDRLLAIVRFQAIALGSASFVLSDTLADLSEGFALDPTGFATVQYQGATVNVVPEPATALLLVLGITGLAARRRRAS